MNTIEKIFLILVIAIFVLVILYYIYEIITKHFNKKYQSIFFLNHPFYNRGHKRRRGKFNCPRGCTNNGKCISGNLCFNCHKEDPHCCCYDQQCAGCIKK